MPRGLRAAVCSRRGPARRSSSDLGLVRADLGFFLLADGDGTGTPAEVAAAAAVRGAERILTDVDAPLRAPTLAARVVDAVAAANLDLWRVSTTQTAYPRMGAAFGALGIVGDRAAFVGVGDVALFRGRAGSLERILGAPWLIGGRLGDAPRLEIEAVELELRAGDVFLMATDGMHPALVRPDELSAAMAQRDPRLAAEYVVAVALDRGGVDDVTALVVRVDVDA